MRFPAILALAMLAPACAPAGSPAAPAPEGACDAAGAQRFVGQPGTPDLAAAAQAAAGARTTRWLRPGMAVTMEFSPDRLNIELDEKNVVVSIRCG